MNENLYTEVPMYMKNPKKLIPLETPYVDTGVRYRWSIAAKLVACTNMLISACVFVLIFTTTIFFIYHSVKLKKGALDPDYEQMIPNFDQEKANSYIVMGSLTLFAATAVNNVEFVMAYILQRSAMMIAPPHEILKKCAIWRNVSILLLVLYTGMLIWYHHLWYLWLWVVFRVICLISGSIFIWDVKREERKLVMTKEKYAD